MKTIPLTQGLFAMVDDADFARVSQFKWTAHKSTHTTYADREIRCADGSRTTQKMHALIMGTPPGFDTHHKNGNGLDNQQSNLKIVSRSAHRREAERLRSNNNSGFRGVWFCKRSRQFCAGVRIHIGYYDTAEEAAKARDAKVRELGWPEEGMNFPVKGRVSLCCGGDFLVQRRRLPWGMLAACSESVGWPGSFGRPQMGA